MGLTHVVCVRSKAEAAFVRPNHLDLFSYLVLDLDGMVIIILLSFRNILMSLSLLQTRHFKGSFPP